MSESILIEILEGSLFISKVLSSITIENDITLNIEKIKGEKETVIKNEQRFLKKIDNLGDKLSSKNIIFLGLSNNEEIPFYSIFDYLTGIKNLYLEDVKLPDKLPQLNSLVIINDKEKQEIYLPNVKRLIISGIKNKEIDISNDTEELIIYHSDIKRYINGTNLKNLTINYSHINNIFQPGNITILNLNNNRIKNIPVNQLINLEELHLSFNQLSEIEYNIIKLRRLTLLDVSNNQIEVIPESLSGMNSLIYLYLDNNLITSIPKFLGKLECSVITLNNNKIKTIPSSIGYSKIDYNINFSFNMLERIKYNLFFLNLKKIYLSNNSIEKIPSSINNLKSLEELDLSYNKLIELPDEICDLDYINVLTLNNNYIKKLPNKFSNISIKILTLSNNNLTIIDNKLNNDIKVLKIDNNFLDYIPIQVLKIKNLTVLDISYNNIQHLNMIITNRLEEFFVNNNNIKTIDHMLYENDKIKILNLSNNFITKISNDISKMKSLKYLYINNNELKSIPKTLILLNKLSSVKLHNNKIETIPKEIFTLDCEIFNGNFSNNNIKELDESIKNFKCFYLDFSNNQLTTFPNIFKHNHTFRLNLDNNKLQYLPEDITLINGLSISGNEDLKLSKKQKNFYDKKKFVPNIINENSRERLYNNIEIINSISIKLMDVINYFNINQKYNMTPLELVNYDRSLSSEARNKKINKNIQNITYFNKTTDNKYRELISDYIYNKSRESDKILKILEPRIKIKNKILINKFFKDKDVEEIRKEINDSILNGEDVIDVLKKYYSDML